LVAVAFLITGVFFWEWRLARQDSAHLQVQIHQAEQLIQQNSAAQQQRDKLLTLTLDQLNSLKSSVKSQHDILVKIPDVLSLPKPLAAKGDNISQGKLRTEATKNPEADKQQPQSAVIPPEDLKPLYDFAVDCKACQAKLAATAADLADEKNKTQALGRERDAALQVARGGSLRQRIKRSAKWFVLGVLAGAVAAKAHSH
jgi:hypothetical protein